MRRNLFSFWLSTHSKSKRVLLDVEPAIKRFIRKLTQIRSERAARFIIIRYTISRMKVCVREGVIVFHFGNLFSPPQAKFPSKRTPVRLSVPPPPPFDLKAKLGPNFKTVNNVKLSTPTSKVSEPSERRSRTRQRLGQGRQPPGLSGSRVTRRSGKQQWPRRQLR